MIVKLTCTFQDLQEYDFYYEDKIKIKICFRVCWESLNLKETTFELFLGLVMVKQGTLYRNQAVQFRATSRLEDKVLKSC